MDAGPPHQEHPIRRGRAAASAAIWQWRSAPQEASRTARLGNALKALVPAVVRRALDALVALLVRIVTWLVLRALFYGVFTPLGWLLRARSHDPMQRASEPARASYWSERSAGGEHVASGKRGRQY